MKPGKKLFTRDVYELPTQSQSQEQPQLLRLRPPQQWEEQQQESPPPAPLAEEVSDASKQAQLNQPPRTLEQMMTSILGSLVTKHQQSIYQQLQQMENSLLSKLK